MLGFPTRYFRIAVQWAMFSLWVGLILVTRHPMDHWLSKNIPVSIFLRIDPLVMTVVCGGMRMAVTLTLLGLVTLAVSLLMGRVFCGWICPLGAIFDGYGWILRKLKVKFEGPSPPWFRFKYYLLFSILIFAGMGGLSPLMGFDPIVLLTRTVATVLNPFLVHKNELGLGVEAIVGKHGAFVDISTLLLFMAIMTGTTRLSRVWCRTACPLGAYLAITSRNALLRRETQGCVHCNICANHCPTGAISFENAEIYNESECIKCFACTQECPVDANYFTWKSPFPTATPSKVPVSLERRDLIATAAFTILAGPGLQLAAGDPGASKKLIRPPMSRDERDFLSSCIRCTECIKACPTGVLKPAGLDQGIRTLWSPMMVPLEGFCMEGCNACSQACPTDAIMKYPIEQKYAYKSGTAVFNSSQCVSYTEQKFCSECIRVCPTDAISYESGWEPQEGLYRGKGSDTPVPVGQKPTRPTKVNFESCVGCGACEYECNKVVMGGAAMVTTSFGRTVPTEIDFQALIETKRQRKKET